MWGWGCAGAKVTISDGGEGGHPPVTTRVSDTGLWSTEVRLAPGGPYSLTLTQETAGHSVSSIKLTDILAGDVWVSN